MIIAFSFFTYEKAFSFTEQEQQIDTTNNATVKTYSNVKGITAGRGKSLIGGVLGLVSLIIGWRAKVRIARHQHARPMAITALVLGLVAIGLSIVHLANVTGGFGTGGGKAGAIVALVFGLGGSIFSWLALRSK